MNIKQLDREPVYYSESTSYANKVNKFITLKNQLKTIKDKLTEVEKPLIELAKIKRLEFITTTRKLVSSFKLRSPHGNILVKFPNKYHKIKIEYKEQLLSIFKDRYNDLFVEKITLALTDKASEDQQFIDLLMGLLGKKKFFESFKISVHIEPKKSYYNESILNEEVKHMAFEALQDNLVISVKPSLVKE